MTHPIQGIEGVVRWLWLEDDVRVTARALLEVRKSLLVDLLGVVVEERGARHMRQVLVIEAAQRFIVSW